MDFLKHWPTRMITKVYENYDNQVGSFVHSSTGYSKSIISQYYLGPSDAVYPLISEIFLPLPGCVAQEGAHILRGRKIGC